MMQNFVFAISGLDNIKKIHVPPPITRARELVFLWLDAVKSRCREIKISLSQFFLTHPLY